MVSNITAGGANTLINSVTKLNSPGRTASAGRLTSPATKALHVEMHAFSKEYLLNVIYEKTGPQISKLLGENEGQTGENKWGVPPEYTPEAVADRIVGMAMNLYETYRAQHPEDSDEEGFKNFMAEVREGVERGFGEAREIIQDQRAMSNEISDLTNETHRLIHDKLDALQASYLS